MTPTPKLVCRLHPSTGQLVCSYELTNRTRPGSLQTHPDPERSHHESVRRARRRVLELVHDHALGLMWTFTYAEEPQSPEEVATTIKHLSRRLRTAGLATSRLTVPEQSANGRWHLHMAVAEYVPRTGMAHAWQNGFVRAPNLGHADGPEALMKISMYLTKAFNTSPAGYRRYIASKGLRPIAERFIVADEAAALAEANRRLGRTPKRTLWYAGNLLAYYPALAPERAA